MKNNSFLLNNSPYTIQSTVECGSSVTFQITQRIVLQDYNIKKEPNVNEDSNRLVTKHNITSKNG